MRVPFSMIASYVLCDHSFKCTIYAFRRVAVRRIRRGESSPNFKGGEQFREFMRLKLGTIIG